MNPLKILSRLALLFSLVLAGCMESIAPKKAEELAAQFPIFSGCIDGKGIDTGKIKINFSIPAFATEFYIYRDGTQVYSTRDFEESMFIDENLTEGHTYAYECKALYEYKDKRNDPQEEILVGTTRLKLSTKALNAPTFNGIKSVTIMNPHKVKVAWDAPKAGSGAEIKSYKVYYKMGSTLNMNSIEPSQSIDYDTFTTTIENLGDELPYSFGVRACSVDDICTDNVNIITKSMTDDGAPTTLGATEIKMDNGKVVLTAPWAEINGAVKKRHLYRSKTGGTNIANYSKIYSEPISDINVAPVTTIIDPSPEENTTYYYIIRDEDPLGNVSTNTSIMTVATGDMTAPQFAGIESTTYVYPEDTAIQLNWKAIDPNDAHDYLVYVTSAKGNATDPLPDPADPCATGIKVRTIASSSYPDGSTVNYKLTGLTPRTTYGICVKAQDAAENKSNTNAFEVVTSKDITPPEFDGIQTLTYGSKITATFNKSLSEDLDGYKILIWKNSTNPAAGDITTVYKKPNELTTISSTTIAYKFDKSNFAYVDYDKLYVIVKACDNASPNFGAQNCSNYPSTFPSDKTKLLELGDTTKPIFAGLTSIDKGNPADKNIVLKWKAIASQPLDTNGAASYLIYQTEVPGVGVPTPPCDQTTPTKTILATNFNTNENVQYELTNHVERKTYSLCMKAVDLAGNISDTTANFTLTTEDVTAPTFAGITSAQYNEGNIDVVWTPSPSSDIKEYKVSIWKNSSTPIGAIDLRKSHALFPNGFTFGTSTFSYTDGDKVYVQVNACDTASPDYGTQNCTNMDLSYAKTVQLNDTTAPIFGGISSAALVDPKDSAAKITWTAIFAEEDNPTLGADEYWVYRTEAEGMTDPLNPCESASTPTVVAKIKANLYNLDDVVTYNMTGLTPRTTYKFCVKARDASGNVSNTSNTASVRTYDLTAPVFTGISGISYDGPSGLLKVIWSESLSSDVSYYKVQLWRNKVTPLPADITTITKTAADFKTGFSFDKDDIAGFTFTDGDKVYVLADACDNAKPNYGTADNCTTKAYSEAGSKLLPDLTPPQGFTGIANVTNVSEGIVTVKWVDPGNWNDYRGFYIYTLSAAGVLNDPHVKDCPCVQADCSDRLIQCNVTGLDNFRTYKFHVRAYDAVGNVTTYLAPTVLATVKTLDTTDPTFQPPDSNITSVMGNGKIALSWNSAIDNQWTGTDAFNATANTITYKLYRKAGAFADATLPMNDGTLLYTGTSTSYDNDLLDSTLIEGTTYHYAVCAYDSSGRGKCDGRFTSKTVSDKTPPVIGSFGISSRNWVSDPSTWNVTFSVTDNSTSNGMSVTTDQISVKIYRKMTDTKTDYPDENISYSHVTTNASATNTNAVLGSLETTEDNGSNFKYYTYRIVAQDTLGLKTVAYLSTSGLSMSNMICPAGYVRVPPNSAVGTTEPFCVMMYEAKNVGGVATSQPELTPWVNIYSYAARTACTTLGAGYDIIKNAEWMTVARNIESLAVNWSSGIVGTGCIFRGNSNAIDTCSYNNNAPDYGTTRNVKARLELSTGDYIWDLAGNVHEVVLPEWDMGDAFLQIGVHCGRAASWYEIVTQPCNSLSSEKVNPLLNINSLHGVGKWYLGADNVMRTITRGGAFGNSTERNGIYNFQFSDYTPSTGIGFRCVYHP